MLFAPFHTALVNAYACNETCVEDCREVSVLGADTIQLLDFGIKLAQFYGAGKA